MSDLMTMTASISGHNLFGFLICDIRKNLHLFIQKWEREQKKKNMFYCINLAFLNNDIGYFSLKLCQFEPSFSMYKFNLPIYASIPLVFIACFARNS